MAHRVSPGGSFRVDRHYPPPVGRLAIASGATTRGAYRNVVACLDRLAERGRLDVLAALKARLVSIGQVLDADRASTLGALLASLTPSPEQLPLWPAVESWLGPKKERGETVKRYGVSFAKLRRYGALPEDAVVAALAEVDWKALNVRWIGSGCDWNRLRQAVSHFLTVHYGDVYDPRRRMIVKAIPKRAEVERVPDLDLATFWRVVEAAPEHIRPAFVALVILGLRTGEYLRLAEHHLHPLTKSVSIPGTKTASSTAVLRVDPELWPWVVAAVPSPVAYQWLRRYWKRALVVAKADPTLRLHDLRHLTAQVLVNVGRTEASVQTTMRHATASMTRRYARQKDRGENAAALARAMLDARPA